MLERKAVPMGGNYKGCTTVISWSLEGHFKSDHTGSPSSGAKRMLLPQHGLRSSIEAQGFDQDTRLSLQEETPAQMMTTGSLFISSR
jgi:hypothetical protein